jgi:hypothetical protein
VISTLAGHYRVDMKTKFLSLSHRRLATPGLLLSLALFLCASASAQNLLKNGDFEQPLGPTNWTVMYLHGGRSDWEVKGRNRKGSLHAAWYGGYFRPITLKMAHACYTQTITNLTPGHAYTVGGAMKHERYNYAGDDLFRDTFLVYMEAIGGRGAPTSDGRFSILATNGLMDINGVPEDQLDPPHIDPPYTYTTLVWRGYEEMQTPDAKGRIEIRLHYYKVGFCIYDKTYISGACFDDIYLTP